MKNTQLGLGLLSIGRIWGVQNIVPPEINETKRLINTAYKCGIKFYDTAPSYAKSESILSSVIKDGIVDRTKITIATKMGEYWNYKDNSPYISHNYNDLAIGLEKSYHLLQGIDILQLHKASLKNIDSTDVIKAFDLANSMGIKQFGVSVTDVETANVACFSGLYDFIQFPYNSLYTYLEKIFELLDASKMKAIINRPFAMGELSRDNDHLDHLTQQFKFIIEKNFSGVILTGTSSEQHLKLNIKAFNEI